MASRPAAPIASQALDQMLEALRLALPANVNPLDRHKFAIEWICQRLDDQGSEIDRLKGGKST